MGSVRCPDVGPLLGLTDASDHLGIASGHLGGLGLDGDRFAASVLGRPPTALALGERYLVARTPLVGGATEGLAGEQQDELVIREMAAGVAHELALRLAKRGGGGPTPKRSGGSSALRTAGFHYWHADGTPYGQPPEPASTDAHAQAFRALRSMGFREKETRHLLAAVQGTHVGADVGDLVRAALRAAPVPGVRETSASYLPAHLAA